MKIAVLALGNQPTKPIAEIEGTLGPDIENW
jgi:hypothetical protein